MKRKIPLRSVQHKKRRSPCFILDAITGTRVAYVRYYNTAAAVAPSLPSTTGCTVDSLREIQSNFEDEYLGNTVAYRILKPGTVLVIALPAINRLLSGVSQR